MVHLIMRILCTVGVHMPLYEKGKAFIDSDDDQVYL
ncbi:hypothetical protein LCGC14_1881020 [marine sediment metagenome]|uniref:Uncharacterized protein n=1 Tax=marine sediment metagenome TaxID=412755 RepID=A0A0F9J0R1_9ZZZZ